MATIGTFNIQLSTEGEVNSGEEKIPRRGASRYVSRAVHRF